MIVQYIYAYIGTWGHKKVSYDNVHSFIHSFSHSVIQSFTPLLWWLKFDKKVTETFGGTYLNTLKCLPESKERVKVENPPPPADCRKLDPTKSKCGNWELGMRPRFEWDRWVPTGKEAKRPSWWQWRPILIPKGPSVHDEWSRHVLFGSLCIVPWLSSF